MMGPYVVAHLNLTLQLSGKGLSEPSRSQWSFGFDDNERLNIFMTNTLEPSTPRSSLLLGSYISDEANAAADVKGPMPVMVVLGNPPYRGHSANASEHTFVDRPTGRKRREPTFIGQLVSDYYTFQGKPLVETNTKWLQDDYVKFIRFGQSRIEATGSGILALITNHGYLDNPTFKRDEREAACNVFADYVLDLHGTLRNASEIHRVGLIKTCSIFEPGVAIAFFVKKPGHLGNGRVFRADLWGTRAHKYEWLLDHSFETADWEEVVPRRPDIAFQKSDSDRVDEFELGWPIDEIFPVHSLGVLTKRDNLAVAYTRDELMEKLLRFMDSKVKPETTAADFSLQLKDKDRWDLAATKKHLAATLDARNIRPISYRPFDERVYYDDSMLIARRNSKVLENLWSHDNLAILVGRQGGEAGADSWDGLSITDQSCDHNLFRRGGATVCPLYVGGPGTSQLLRQPNLSLAFCEALAKRLSKQYGDSPNTEHTVSPESIFYYIYAVLWSNEYRKRFDHQLKRGFPRIPLTSNQSTFNRLSHLGKELVDAHLLKSIQGNRPRFPVSGNSELKLRFLSIDLSRRNRRILMNTNPEESS